MGGYFASRPFGRLDQGLELAIKRLSSLTTCPHLQSKRLFLLAFRSPVGVLVGVLVVHSNL